MNKRIDVSFFKKPVSATLSSRARAMRVSFQFVRIKLNLSPLLKYVENRVRRL